MKTIAGTTSLALIKRWQQGVIDISFMKEILSFLPFLFFSVAVFGQENYFHVQSQWLALLHVEMQPKDPLRPIEICAAARSQQSVGRS